MKIHILVTGGTFDKKYDEIQGKLTFKSTHLPEILKIVRCTVPITCQTMKLVDSLKMTYQDRLDILEVCQQTEASHIIITHGTDTMVETAKVLGEAQLDKSIVLTGAMVPYSVSSSDALFNLGCSISAVQHVENGVYIIMNGQTFHWNNVRKNKELGVFETLDNHEVIVE